MKKLMFLLCVVTLSACGNNETNNEPRTQDMAPDLDMAVDMPDLQGDETPDVKKDDVCMPTDPCTAGVCGIKDDGCGGTVDCGSPKTCDDYGAGACGVLDNACGGLLDCGTCACENGMPTNPVCGACGLSIAGCNGDEATCEQSLQFDWLDDQTDCAQSIMYVDAGYIGVGLGTADEPYQKVDEALDNLKASTRLIVVREGTYSVNKSVILPDGVSIVGGFGGQDTVWLYQPNKQSTLNVTVSAAPVRGLIVEQTTKQTWIGHMVFTVNAQNVEKDLYGAWLHKANDVTFYKSFLTVLGKAGDGIKGTDGASGQVGVDAPNAPNNFEPNYAPIQQALAPTGFTLTKCDRSANPTPGTVPCLAGGEGGTGAWLYLTDMTYSTNGKSGEGNNAGAGGIGADGIVSTSGDPGTDGRDGAGGARGRDGRAEGQVVNGLWVSLGDGADGTKGNPGGGGGGGGGGGYRVGVAEGRCYIREGDNGIRTYWIGGIGGEGGAGGQEGFPGTAATGGGSTFGVFASQSKVDFIESQITSGDAGASAEGGKGGQGGLGGDGGNGTTDIKKPNSINTITHMCAGGRGGQGGTGGKGGDGGNGAAGSSFGVFCHMTQASQQNTMFSAGKSGRDDNNLPGVAAKTSGCGF